MSTRKTPVIYTTLLAGVCAAPIAWGDDNRSPHCPSPVELQAQPLESIETDRILLRGDRGSAQQGERFLFEGDILLRYAEQALRADRAQFDKPSQHLQAEGHIRLQTPGLIVLGESADLKLKDNQGLVKQARYRLIDHGGRGRAEQLQVKGEFAELQGATYSTCAEGRESWQLSASSLTLDRQANEGVARHVILEVADVPVFYLPWVSFALEGRKTGFLPPVIGYSDEDGADLAVPYYFNLAPHRDATLTPRVISKRGAQLGGEFRYLNRNSGGLAYAEHLPDDQLADKDRSLVSYRHKGKLRSNWQYSARLTHVTDIDYFRDLGNNLSDTGQTQLERNARSEIIGKSWSFSALVQDYQMLSAGVTEPHRRLPQLRYQSSWQGNWLRPTILSEYTYFQHDKLRGGQRLLLEPAISSGYQNSAGYITPRLRVRHNQYLLESHQQNREQQQDISAASFSLDSGLFLQRRLRGIDQTLEPRIYYLHSPAEKQQHLPNFDSALLDISYAQLFRDFRYSGGDRFGDDQRLSTGLTSRFISHQDGRELLRLSLAHAYYFADQKVSLGETPRQQDDQLLAAEVASEFLPKWQLRSSVFQDIEQDRPDKAAIQVNYDSDRRGLDLSARYRQQQLKQIGAGGYLSLNSQWHLAGKWIYSLRDKRSAERLIGAEYRSCCWSLRLVAQEYIKNAAGDTDRQIGVQVELTGLTSLGKKMDARLSRQILGYRTEG